MDKEVTVYSRISVAVFGLFLAAPLALLAQESTDQLGEVSFSTSCADDVKADFDRAVALLHSFEFEESRGVFETIAARDADCAMAHWGVAMTYYHPLWAPPTDTDLELGHAAAGRAQALSASEREEAHIEAIATFYRDYETLDHRTRAWAYEEGMAKAHATVPDDRESEIFYLLAVLSNADPTDKTYAVQKRTGARAEELWAEMPDHPGLVHYIIHSYDYPPLADQAVEAAHGALAQAQLGEMHALDYLAYAYLQQGRDEQAREVLDHIDAIEDLNWKNGVVAFNAGAVPARFTLERRQWKAAASLSPPAAAEDVGGVYETRVLVALRYWVRAVGAARSGQIEQAGQDLVRLTGIAAELEEHRNVWARNTSEVLRLEAAAWLALAQGENEQALALMRTAAELEDETDKSGLSPGRVLPVHEQLGDMLMELGRPAEAQQEYETSLQHARHRFNSIYGAARAARAAGDEEAARGHYQKLLELASPDSARPEVQEARVQISAN